MNVAAALNPGIRGSGLASNTGDESSGGTIIIAGGLKIDYVVPCLPRSTDVP